MRFGLREMPLPPIQFLQCTHPDEWQCARELRQRYFFDKVPILDPYTWTFTHSDHLHWVLYCGEERIGYAHIQLWPNSRAAIRIIAVEESWRQRGLGSQFLLGLEAWLEHHGYRSLHTESSPTAVKFYEKLGYSMMPFDDPDEYESDPRDTPMGKLLGNHLLG